MKRTAVKSVIFFLLAACFSSAGASTIDEWKQAVDRDKNNVISRFNLGLAYYNELLREPKNELVNRTIDTMRRVLEMNPSAAEDHAKVDFQAAQIAGIVYYNYRQNDKEAIKYFKKASELNPADASNFFFKGLAYLRMNDFDSAINVLEQSISKGLSLIHISEPTRPY